MVKKVLLGVFAFIILLLIAVISFGPDLANSYLTKHSKELTGRVFTSGNLDLNLFTGDVIVDDFVMYEQDEKTIFVSLEKLDLNISLKSLINGDIDVDHLTLTKPYVNLFLKNKLFNFDSFSSSDSTEKDIDTIKSDPFIKSYSLNNIKLISGALNYDNFDQNINHHAVDLNAELPSINFGGGDSDLDLEFNFEKGGKIASDFVYHAESGDFQIVLEILKLNLNTILPYLQPSLNIGHLQGSGDAYLKLKGNIDDFLGADIYSKITLSDVSISDINQNELISIDTNQVVINKLNIDKEIYDIEKIEFNGAKINFVKDKNTTNFSTLVKEEKKDSIKAKLDTVIKKELKKTQWNVNKFNIINSKVFYTDNTLNTKFNYELKNVSIETDKIKEGHKSQMNIAADTHDGGHIRVEAHADVADIMNGNFNVYLNRISAKDFDAYSEYNTAYPLLGGKIDISLINNIKDAYLQSSFVIDAYSLSLGDKNDKIKPQVDLPLKTALYMMKDSDDIIHIEMPMEGNLKDPSFSYRKTISKVFINTIFKIATSPLSILSKGLGFKSDKLDVIQLKYWQWELHSEDQIVVDKLVSVLEQKKDISAVIYFQSNPELEEKNLAIYLEQLDFFNWKYKKEFNFKNIRRSEQEIVNGIRIKDADFIEYFNNKYNKSASKSNIEKQIIEARNIDEIRATLKEMNRSLLSSLEEYVASKNTNKLKVKHDIQMAKKNESSMFRVEFKK